MKRTAILGIVLFLAFLTFITQAQAKWWIFGKAEDNPEISQLFVANMEVTSREDMFLDKSNLEGGDIVIKGFARAAQAPLAVAKISLDGGQTWEDINLDKGAFVYQFAPVEGREYDLQFKVMDTAGKESDIRDISRIKLIYRTANISQLIEETLRSLIEAYESQNASRFMENISSSFRGDAFALEEAVQSDCRNYDNINMAISVQQVSKIGNEAKILFDFEWRAIKKSDGSIVAPSRGSTTYTFVHEAGRYKLLSMATPIIFGISRASEITTGSTSSEKDATATTFSSQDTDVSLTTYTASINCGFGIDFSTQQVVAVGGDIIFNDGCGATALDGGPGSALISLLDSSGASLSSHATVTEPTSTSLSNPTNGYIYSVKDSNNKYSIFKITGGSPGSNECLWQTLNIQYKYQSDGTKNVP